jgi:predicted dehydrogenase
MRLANGEAGGTEMMNKVSRRSFMAGAVTAASALRVLGANDRIRLGIIGSGLRGQYLMKRANEIGNLEWVAVCDAWDLRRDQAEQVAGTKLVKYVDYHQLLERRDIDGVIVATFDNMHAQITADACRAGKDVFVEKPMTSQPMQGLEVVRAVRETKCVVQVGMQQRSTPHFIEAKRRFFDSKLMGRVNMVRTIWNANGGYLTPVPTGMDRKPEGLDWERCLGWLPKIPWDAKRYFNRFAYWDLSTGGQTGGLFVHMVDVVHWFLGIDRPAAAVAMGGIYLYDDGRDTPDNISLALEYPEKINVTFEATLTDMIPQGAADIVFMGAGGRLSIFRYGYTFLPSRDNAQLGEINSGATQDFHVANWLDCMRSRLQSNADVVSGHYSSMACHIGNIAYREKRQVVWQKEWEV